VQVFKDLFGDMLYSEGFSLRPVLLHPQTRGVVRLRSSVPTDQPYIEPNYLAHPDDIKILVEGMIHHVFFPFSSSSMAENSILGFLAR